MEVSFKTAEAKQCRDLSPVANFMHNNVHDELARSRAQRGRHDFVVFEGIRISAVERC